MNTQDLKKLKQKLAQLDVQPQRLLLAIDCALMNTHEPVTNDWLRAELEAFHAAHG